MEGTKIPIVDRTFLCQTVLGSMLVFGSVYIPQVLILHLYPGQIIVTVTAARRLSEAKGLCYGGYVGGF